MKSHFWRYKQANHWTKPVYFPEEIDVHGFRRYLRNFFDIEKSTHIEVDCNGSEYDRLGAIKRHFDSLKPRREKQKRKRKPKLIKISFTQLPNIIKQSMGKSCLSVK